MRGLASCCRTGSCPWSYLYRHMIAPLTDAGHRVVVPDLVGFGRSDKPADRAAYTYQRHPDWLREVALGCLDLRNVTVGSTTCLVATRLTKTGER
jgi:haloalkane dehalogenase